MTCSLIIPTYNRLEFWRRGLLLDSIRQQRRAPDEIVICDDNSTDGTASQLRELLGDLPARLFRVTVPKQRGRQASALPDNVLIREARGDILVHLDDDGWIPPNYVELALSLSANPGLYYAAIDFYNPDTLELLYGDTRLKDFEPDGPVRLRDSACWGAAWVAPRAVVCELGGHQMDVHFMLGADSRLGWRLCRRLSAWLVPGLKFHHLGPSYLQALRLTKKVHLLENNRLSPVRDRSYQPEVVANGGSDFWEHGLAGMYEALT